VSSSFDLDRLEDGSYALMPLLYRRLMAWNADALLTTRLKGLYRHTWYRNNVLVERLKEVLHLGSAGSAELLLVGEPRLLLRAYGDLGLRPSSRIDLVVRPQAIPRLTTALTEAGWSLPTGSQGRYEPRTIWLERADAPTVALQRRLLPQRGSDEIEDRPWQHARSVVLDGSAHPASSATDELLRTCIGEERRWSWNRLQWIADANMLLLAEGDALDWERVLADAASYRATLLLRDALVYLRDRIAAPVPEETLRRLENARSSTRERLVHRLSRVDRFLLSRMLPRFARRAVRRIIPPS
jgi:hypothetical protein